MNHRTGRLDLEINQDQQQGGFLAVMRGQIDERADLVRAVDGLSGRVIIDLAGVTFINSIGVREWIKMLRALEARRVPATLKRCSETMVMQMNMIIETQTNAQVESFFAPYLCDACGYEGSVCIEVKDHARALAAKAPPSLPCPECRAPMQFNEIPGRYLLFLEQPATGAPKTAGAK